jgi:putative aldouronate transport system substrate-binding protein
MRKIIKKSLSFTLTTIIGISIFAGCNKNNSQTTNKISQNNNVEHVAGVWPMEGNPELTITLIQDPNVLSWDADTNALTKWLEDETGVKLKFNFLPSSNASEKLNLELATNGNLGDIVFVNFSIPKGLQQTYGGQQILAPLQDLVENYTVNIKRQFETVEGAKQLSTTPDGNMYALPYVGNCYNCTRQERAWIHSEFLEKYGKGMPQTTDELYDYLKWVSENDANGNGENDEIPWAAALQSVWEATPTDFVMNAFTLKDQNSYYVNKDDTIHAAFAEDGWRKGLKFLNTLYSEKLLDSTSFTNDSSSFQSLIALNDGRTVGFVAAGGVNNISPDPAIRQLYINVPPLKGPDGLQYGFHQIFGQVSGQRYMIPEKSKNKEVAIRFLDYLYTQEVWMRFRRGIPDVDWIVPEGKLSVKGTPALFEVIDDIWGKPTTHSWQNTLPGWGLVTADDSAALSSDEYDAEAVMFLAARAVDDYVIPVEVPTFYYDEDISDDVAMWSADLASAWVQAAAEFITGTRNIDDDKQWDNYIKELETYGLTKYLNAQQKVFDATWKGKYPHEYTKPTGFADERITND